MKALGIALAIGAVLGVVGVFLFCWVCKVFIASHEDEE